VAAQGAGGVHHVAFRVPDADYQAWADRLRRLRRQARRRPFSGQSIRQPRLPGGDPLPRHRELARLRPRAGRERLCRALHPSAEGEPDTPAPAARCSRPG
jgi:hypothetical protein